MKFSTRSVYGIRALVELAMNYTEGPMRITTIAERERISNKYLEQIFNLLKIGGLVLSVRGPKGGYILARPPEDVRLNYVFTLLEGRDVPPDCSVHKDYHSRCGDCIVKNLRLTMQAAVDNVLGSMTLKDMIEKDFFKEFVSKAGM